MSSTTKKSLKRTLFVEKDEENNQNVSNNSAKKFKADDESKKLQVSAIFGDVATKICFSFNCHGTFNYLADTVSAKCFRCAKVNCLQCQAIHKDQTCEQYKKATDISQNAAIFDRLKAEGREEEKVTEAKGNDSEMEVPEYGQEKVAKGDTKELLPAESDSEKREDDNKSDLETEVGTNDSQKFDPDDEDYELKEAQDSKQEEKAQEEDTKKLKVPQDTQAVEDFDVTQEYGFKPDNAKHSTPFGNASEVLRKKLFGDAEDTSFARASDSTPPPNVSNTGIESSDDDNDDTDVLEATFEETDADGTITYNCRVCPYSNKKKMLFVSHCKTKKHETNSLHFDLTGNVSGPPKK